MKKVMYCRGCQREVEPVKKDFPWMFAIVGGLLSFGIIFIFCVLRQLFRKKNRCSDENCRMKVITIKKAQKLGYFDTEEPEQNINLVVEQIIDTSATKEEL